MNAPLYGTPEPALADAYRVTAQAVRRECNRDDAVGQWCDETLAALACNPMAKTAAYWNIRPVCSLMADLVAWVYETDDDPEMALANALAYPPTAGKALREKYALARAEAKALEFERNGGNWLEV